MMKVTFRVVLIAVMLLLLLSAVAVPSIVSAQFENAPKEGVFVPDCNFGEEDVENCGVKHLYTLADKVMRVLIWLATLGVAVVIAFYGIRLAMNSFKGDHISIIKEAQQSIMYAIGGLVLVLGAWLIVQFFFETLGYKQIDTLFEPHQYDTAAEAGAETDTSAQDDTAETDTDASAGDSGRTGYCPNKPGRSHTCSCVNCQALESVLPCKDNCQADRGLSNKIRSLEGKVTDDWWVTEGYPPVVGHSNPCHYNGTCIDANFYTYDSNNKRVSVQKPSVEQIKNFIDKADQHNLRAKYEVSSVTRQLELTASGVLNKSQVIVVAGVAPHFSVYDCDYNPTQCDA